MGLRTSFTRNEIIQRARAKYPSPLDNAKHSQWGPTKDIKVFIYKDGKKIEICKGDLIYISSKAYDA